MRRAMPMSCRLLTGVLLSSLFAPPGLTQSAVDPMQPSSSVTQAQTLPLQVVTITTTDLLATRRFYEGAMHMRMELSSLLGDQAAVLSEHWGLPAAHELVVASFTRPQAGTAASVRALVVPADTPLRRPAYDSRHVGPLGFGFPIHDLARRHAIASQLGFDSTAGVLTMAFPRADGTTYDVGEFHLMAPDNVLVLGVDRGSQAPIGDIDAALDIGGVAYSSIFVSDIARTGEFLREVLGLELRREMSFRSGGPDGGLRGLQSGQEVAFQQWFSPGASTGYLVVMELLEGDKLAAPEAGALRRGVAMWSFEVRDLDALLARWQRWSSHSPPAVRTLTLPEVGEVRAVVLHTPDGMPVELFQRP